MMYRMLWVALVSIVAGCSASHGECGRGSSIRFDERSYCVFAAGIVEEGFRCPPGLSFRHDFEAFTACSQESSPPDAGFDEYVEDRLVLRVDASMPPTDGAVPPPDRSSPVPHNFACGAVTEVRTVGELLAAIPEAQDVWSGDLRVSGVIDLEVADLPAGIVPESITRAISPTRAVSGVTCTEASTVAPGCARVRIEASTVRVRKITPPQFTGGGYLLYITKPCTAPCEADELACDARRECMNYEDHCSACELNPVDYCTCQTPGGPKADGASCSYYFAVDAPPATDGTCRSGMCEG